MPEISYLGSAELESKFSPITRAKSTYFDFNNLKEFLKYYSSIELCGVSMHALAALNHQMSMQGMQLYNRYCIKAFTVVFYRQQSFGRPVM